MKKGSSGNKNRDGSRRHLPPGRYPTRDNVYSLQRERQRRGNQQKQPNRQGQPKKKLQKAGQEPRGYWETATPKHYKKRKNGHLIAPFVIFGFIAVYLCGQMLMLAVRRSDINVETVAYGTIDTPQMYSGLIVREEYVINSDRSGQPFYQFSQGDRVTKGAVVCTVKDTDSTDILEDRLDKIDQDILKSQKVRTDLSAFSEDITRLENNVTRTVDAYAGRTMKANLTYMYTMKSQVTSFMNQRNDIWLTENVESLSQLTEEKNITEQQLAKNMSAVTAQESGVLSLSYDGLEETLTPAGLHEITKKQMGTAKTEYISKAKAIAEGDPLFRIVASNRWYIACYLPNAVAAGWEKGDGKKLNVMAGEEAFLISTVIEEIETGEKETKVVFSSYEHMEEFMDNRTLSFSLESEMVEGLKIPNTAIVEKSLIRIPRECMTESAGNKGVLLMNGDKAKFAEISPLTGDTSYVYIEQDNGSLKMGNVILKGTGENAEQYTVSDLEPRPGVYVANSSMAKFVVIDILEQNKEYAIVRAGDITGLQPYDTIVSDAKNITEGQDIY